MKTIYNAVERFCSKHPYFGIPNLMRYVCAVNVVVYILMFLSQAANANAISFLFLNTSQVLRGEVWRIITYAFVPTSSSPFMVMISLYFYYWIGTTLERQWGTAKLNLYYFSGILLTAIGAIISTLVTHHSITVIGSQYVNLSMFLAFACLFPDAQVLLFFIIPIRMKWLAIIDGGLFALDIVGSLIGGSLSGVILPVIALLNFAVFIYPAMHYKAEQTAYRYRPQAVNFKKAVKQQQESRGYHHKCSVCGRTDTDHPDLQFRYCSKCAGYHCFCEEHIFSHIHFTEE